jgi:hypothetical protein
MSTWPKHSAAWNSIGPPMRPSQQVIDLFQDLAGPEQTMMMGVTPEFHPAFEYMIAVDRDEGMIDKVWLGDTKTKRVIHSNWMDMIWPEDNFSSIIGDCALPMLTTLDRMTEFQQRCYKWLKPGGVFVQRLFERPNEDYTWDQLVDMVSKPADINFHAFKWVACMSLAAEVGYKISDPIRFEYLNKLCADRAAVCKSTGWTREAVDTIDMYENGVQAVAFCNRAEWQSTVPEDALEVSFLYAYDYDLWQHCPILTWKKPE